MGRAWNGNQCFLLFFFFREPGSPLSSFVSTDPVAAPCSMASRGATSVTRQHRLTNHTGHVSTTTQPYSSLILWTGTSRVWNAKKDRAKEAGRRTVKRGEGEEGNQLKHNLIYSYICDWCVHDNTADNHYRHSHCLLNLIFTEKYRGMETHKGRRRKGRCP